MTTRRGTLAIPAVLGAALVALAVLPTGVAAQAEIHGFVEGAYGLRTAESSVHEDAQDFTLQETRAQLRLTAYGDVGEGFLRLDVTRDALAGTDTEVELREGYLRFTTLGNDLDVKVGRQALTWGTGDLVFVNDLFPKDWESFFSGREDQYLKAPSDALRLGYYGLPFDVDLVITPEFTPDRTPTPGGRFSVTIPEGFGPTVLPEDTAGNMEWALRLSRYVGNFTASLYGYYGFFKTPTNGAEVNPAGPLADPTADPTVPSLFPSHPELSVYGASLRGAVPGGIGWLEGGWYDSREDRDGDDPMVENSSIRYLAGYEKQLWTDFNLTLQYYGESRMEHDQYVAGLAPGQEAEDEHHQLWTVRAEQYLHYQTIRLSLFTFLSPSDEDAHVRLLASYKVSDDVEVVLGSNLFEGDSPTTFGAFDEDDNVYTRLRYSF
jgi:hypothetical protein